jgi:hypothetical protein
MTVDTSGEKRNLKCCMVRFLKGSLYVLGGVSAAFAPVSVSVSEERHMLLLLRVNKIT